MKISRIEINNSPCDCHVYDELGKEIYGIRSVDIHLDVDQILPEIKLTIVDLQLVAEMPVPVDAEIIKVPVYRIGSPDPQYFCQQEKK